MVCAFLCNRLKDINKSSKGVRDAFRVFLSEIGLNKTHTKVVTMTQLPFVYMY